MYLKPRSYYFKLHVFVIIVARQQKEKENFDLWLPKGQTHEISEPCFGTHRHFIGTKSLDLTRQTGSLAQSLYAIVLLRCNS
jgi:hypothetical protein